MTCSSSSALASLQLQLHHKKLWVGTTSTALLCWFGADRHPHCPLHGVCSACCAMGNDARRANTVKTIMFDSSSFLVWFELPSLRCYVECLGSHLEDFRNFICSRVRATHSLIKTQRKLACLLQCANQAEFAPWYSIEKPCFGRFANIISSALWFVRFIQYWNV